MLILIELVYLTINGELIKTTYEHLFFVKDVALYDENFNTY
jgi:hypothetical protein